MKGLFGIGTVLGLTVFDLAVKSEIEQKLKLGEERTISNTNVVVRNVHNEGLCLGTCRKNPKFVKISSLVVTGILSIYHLISLRQKTEIMKKIGISFVLGGAWSNTIDRWVHGYVVDYIGFSMKNEKISRITYNLGDFFIMIGSIILLFRELFKKQEGL